MKLKNIYGKKINVEGKPVQVDEVVEAMDSKSNEVQNLIRHKFVEIVVK